MTNRSARACPTGSSRGMPGTRSEQVPRFKLLKSGKMKPSPSCTFASRSHLSSCKATVHHVYTSGTYNFFFFLMQREEILNSLLSELNPS